MSEIAGNGVPPLDDREVLEAHACGMNVAEYAFVRAHLASHEEVLDAHAKEVDLRAYAYLRHYAGDRSHEEAMEVCLKGIPWWKYVFMRDSGLSHAGAIEALLASVDS